jgi:hypothetical protein
MTAQLVRSAFVTELPVSGALPDSLASPDVAQAETAAARIIAMKRKAVCFERRCKCLLEEGEAGEYVASGE